MHQEFATVHPNLIEFEQPVNGLGIAFLGRIEQSPALIQLFFFCMGSSPSLHRATPFSSRSCSGLGQVLINLTAIITEIQRFTKKIDQNHGDFLKSSWIHLQFLIRQFLERH
ncbi:MAG: hypothetical protein FJ249_03750 [Nitrospira sp.]|nr:hypothetical protein [Nitrospira sp.]